MSQVPIAASRGDSFVQLNQIWSSLLLCLIIFFYSLRPDKRQDGSGAWVFFGKRDAVKAGLWARSASTE